MNPTKPYFFEALYKCISDSGLTPLVIAKSDLLGVKVPPGHDQDGHIVLDLSHDAVTDLEISGKHVAFEAIFDNHPFQVHLPMHAIVSIRCAENEVGIDFGIDPAPDDEDVSGEGDSDAGKDAGGKPKLRVL